MFRSTFFTICISLLLTLTAFSQAATPSPASAPSSGKSAKSPIFRPTKDQIKQVQGLLKEKKLYTGDASGSYNDDTRTGIKSFQKDNGLKQTGTLNRATLEKFGITLTDSQKAIPVSQSSFASATDSTSGKASGPNASGSKASGSSAPSEKRPAPFRANADQIRGAQKLLKDGKMYTGEQTGKLDDATRQGLRKYQEANGLKVTGTLNAVTLEKMGITLTEAQKGSAAAPTAAAPKK